MKSILLFLIFWIFSCSGMKGQKFNGINFVGTPNEIDAQVFEPVLELEANTVCFVPFAYTSKGSTELKWKNLEWQWWGESLEGVRHSLQLANKQGLKTMVKPQIWISHGSFTGHFAPENKSGWPLFEKQYMEYILEFADLCEQEKAEVLIIGTELCRFVDERPLFWSDLIREVRKRYSGKLSYAANWDTYEDVSFWNELDFIGVDAYFPLSGKETPKLKSLLFSWEKYHDRIEKLSKQTGKKVLFTEFGYRSMNYCAKEPWYSGRDAEINHEAQYNAYQAIFTRFWDEEWFAGGMLWKWFPEHQSSGGSGDNRFTPQNKPAEKLIQSWFGKS